MPKELVYAVKPRINGINVTIGSLPEGVMRQGTLLVNGDEKALFEGLLRMMNQEVIISFHHEEEDLRAQESKRAYSGRSSVRIFPFLGSRQENCRMTDSIIKHCREWKREIDFEIPGVLTCLRHWRYCRYYFSSVPTVLLELTNISPEEKKVFNLHLERALMEYYGLSLAADRVDLYRRALYNVEGDEQAKRVHPDKEPDHQADEAEGPVLHNEHKKDNEHIEQKEQQKEQNGQNEYIELKEQTEQNEHIDHSAPNEYIEQNKHFEHSAQNEHIRHPEQNGHLEHNGAADSSVAAARLVEEHAPITNELINPVAVKKEKGTAGKRDVNNRKRSNPRRKKDSRALFLPPDGPLFQFTSTKPVESGRYPLPPHIDNDHIVPFSTGFNEDSQCSCNVSKKTAQSKDVTPGVRCVPVNRETVKLPPNLP